MTGPAATEVYGPYETGDPSKPYGAGAKAGATGALSYSWKFGLKARADTIAGALRAGLVTPREVDGLTADQEVELAEELERTTTTTRRTR